jgi:hypothetical protein
MSANSGYQIIFALIYIEYERRPSSSCAANAKYPRNLPLQSTPPTLLMSLPPLPKELQYRIVGSTLVLYDMSSGLIVDFIPNAVPAA